MPAPDVHTVPRGRPLLAVLFWIGVGFAPIAAGLLLVAKSNGTLRIAAVVAVLSVVLIGLSVALRGDAETVRQELEETLFDEVDGLHKGLRNDIDTAARATHKAFGEKLHMLQNQVEVLRGQLETASAELERRGPAVPERAADFARHGEPAGHDLHPQAPSSRPERTPASAPRSFDASVSPPPVNVAAASRPPLPGGVVRHTETVHVTTRHTFVGQSGEAPGPGMGHGRVYGAQDAGSHWATPEPQFPAATGSGPDRWAPEPRRQRRGGTGDRRSPYDRPGPEPDDEAGWSDLRAGDRWASVRADEQGRELRMGERQAAVRADGSGTEFRIEDRWAAVRQDDPRPHGSGHRDSWREDHRTDDTWQDRAGDDQASHGHWSPHRGWDGAGEESSRGARALPSAEPSGAWRQSSGSWEQRWDEPERERVRRDSSSRGAEDYGAASEGRRPPSGGGAPRVDFGPSDDRWR